MKEKKKVAEKFLNERIIYEVLILKGRDSEEDILYLGKILKGKERLGFVTFPLHYKEYIEIIKKAEKFGKFPKGVKTENIETSQNLDHTIYGILGLSEEKIKRKSPDYVKNRDEKLLRKIKNIIKKFL
jgi:hypothetical protein